MRKEVDEAIAQAKVRSFALFFCLVLENLEEYLWKFVLVLLISYLAFQESPMPDPSELFTNVYVKDFGVEVHIFYFYFFWVNIYFILRYSAFVFLFLSIV